VPAEKAFATKPQLLLAMIERVLAAGTPFGWVITDEAYGDNGPLRVFLENARSATFWPSPAITWSAQPPATARMTLGRETAVRGLPAAQLHPERQVPTLV
jgi:hypothetical protein